MNERSARRLLYVWLTLSAITALSWLLGSAHGGADATVNAAVTYSALAIAAVKARVITIEFMEARRFSRTLQLALDAWLLILAAALTAIYAFQWDMPPV